MSGHLNLDAYDAAYKAQSEAIEAIAIGLRCGGFVPRTKPEADMRRLACEAGDAAYTATLEALGVDDKAAENLAKSAADKSAEDVKSTALKASREERSRAYRAAYEGPVSTIDSVMLKLIKADRTRCRKRLER